MQENNFLQDVKAHYEALPYPPRDPMLEHQRLLHQTGDNFIVLNHHCYQGKRDFSKGFRALVAGGGTGDALIYLAEQLRHFDAEVTYLDLSEASMAVAQERARIRGLDNIRWLNDSILNLPNLKLGKFDYISCTGVLHHLESTEAGLESLKKVLDEDGVILLMLYGKYGRRSVYDMQSLLKNYLPDEATIPEKVTLTRQLIEKLPPTNSFVKDIKQWSFEISAEGFGDEGLYDLLLHSQDRCFTVSEVYDLAESAELELLSFIDRANEYDPATLLDPTFNTDHLKGLSIKQKQIIAEEIGCELNTHEFYLGHPNRHKPAQLDNEDNTLSLMGKMHGDHTTIGQGLTPGRTITFSGRGGNVVITGNPINRVLFANMDSKTPISKIYKRVQKAVPGTDKKSIKKELSQIYKDLHQAGYLYLLHKGSYGTKVPDYSVMQPF